MTAACSTAIPFSVELEGWLRSDQPKTLGELTTVFAERGFAVAIVLLMFTPALPVPTGGVTHLFEGITIVLGGEMLLGRRTVWLPARWSRRSLGEATTERVLPVVVRWVRRVERISRPRGSRLLRHGLMLRLCGLIVVVLAAAAALAPPFSGLDTLPAMGAIAVALAILLEDVVVLVAGVVLGAVGVALIVTVGAMLVRIVRGLV
jgi:hypothetical protein